MDHTGSVHGGKGSQEVCLGEESPPQGKGELACLWKLHALSTLLGNLGVALQGSCWRVTRGRLGLSADQILMSPHPSFP